MPWLLLTVAVYGMILIGGFVVSVGRDNTPTLEYFWTAFSIENGVGGWFLSGSAWNSFIVTMEVALIAMPFTAALGILTAWLLDRQQLPRPPQLRVPRDDELRHSRHGDRRRLHPGIQRATGVA